MRRKHIFKFICIKLLKGNNVKDQSVLIDPDISTAGRFFKMEGGAGRKLTMSFDTLHISIHNLLQNYTWRDKWRLMLPTPLRELLHWIETIMTY